MRRDLVPLEIWELIIRHATTPRWHESDFPKLPAPKSCLGTLTLVCKSWAAYVLPLRYRYIQIYDRADRPLARSPAALFRTHLVSRDLAGHPVGQFVYTLFLETAAWDKQHAILVDIFLHCPNIRFLVLRTSSPIPAPDTLVSSLRLCPRLQAACLPVSDTLGLSLVNHLPNLRHLVLKMYNFVSVTDPRIAPNVAPLRLPHLTRLNITWVLQFDLRALWAYLSRCHFPALRDLRLWLSWTRGWEPAPIKAFFTAHTHIQHIDLAIDHTFDLGVLGLGIPFTTIRLIRVPPPNEVLSLLPPTMRKLIFASVTASEVENFHSCLNHIAAESSHPEIEEIQVNKIARGTRPPAVFHWRDVGGASPSQTEENDTFLYGFMLMHTLQLQRRQPRGLRLLDNTSRTMSVSIH